MFWGKWMNTPTGHTHGDMVDRLNNGDEKVLGELLIVFGSAIRRRLTRKYQDVLGTEDIEDLLWTAIEKVWFRRDQFDPLRGSLNGWLRVIAEHAGYFCLPLEQVGLNPNEPPASLTSSCECVQPSPARYVAPDGSQKRAIFLEYVNELFDSDDVSTANNYKDETIPKHTSTSGNHAEGKMDQDYYSFVCTREQTCTWEDAWNPHYVVMCTEDTLVPCTWFSVFTAGGGDCPTT